MRFLIFIFCFFSFQTISHAAAVAIVQHKKVESQVSATSVALTLDAATGYGNLLVAALGNSGTRTVTSVSDGLHAFTPVLPSAVGTAGTLKTDVWYLTQSTAGQTTITATFSGANGTFDKEIWFWEVSGFSPKAITDVTNHVDDGAQAGGAATGASVTTTSTKGFIVGVDKTASVVSENPKAGNEFTSGGDITGYGNAGCSLISTTAAGHQPAWTDDGSSFASSTVAFKEAAPSQSKIQGVSTVRGVSTIR